MKKEFDQIYLETAADWRNWLAENGETKKGVWLVYFKKHTGKPRVAYNDAVDEALCFGWIDSTVKRIDEARYMQQFTPRNAKSNWSDINKKKIAQLTKSGKMMPTGMKAVKIAKQNGQWYKPDRPAEPLDFSPEILKQLKEKSKAFHAYQTMAPSHRKQFANWVMSAKKEETRLRRCNEMIAMLLKGEGPGMK